MPEIVNPTHIEIKGARANNLKNIDVKLPKNQLIVVTGVSGSGKSSLTMDTLYAEGQRRYVESLSSYARQFLGRMKKPEVDHISGLCPAIAIEQKVSSSNARSTVGTLTEIYDYLRQLYGRIGKMLSPVSGKEVKRDSISDVVDHIMSLEEGEKLQLYAPLPKDIDRTLKMHLGILQQKGYTRIVRKGALVQIDELLENSPKWIDKNLLKIKEELYLLIDRFVVKKDDEDNINRIADSVTTAFQEGLGEAIVHRLEDDMLYDFNNRFEADGISFPEVSPQLFNFNNPYGACPTCEGYGRVMGISEDKVIPDKSKSLYAGAVACWNGEKLSKWKDLLIQVADLCNFPIHRAYQDLTDEEKDILWKGNSYFIGINGFFDELKSKTYKIQNRVLLARYRGRTSCSDCYGGRLRKEAQYVKIAGHNIKQLVNLPIDELVAFFDSTELSEFDVQVSSRLLVEIKSRLEVMMKVGLKYLTLDRLSATLSGGETQRINLTRTLGSNLTSSLYILDEPSVGLHPRDTQRLLEVLKALRDLGNTVVVVEHEEEVMNQCDYLLDIGPAAGIQGGEVVYAGPFKQIKKKAGKSLTTQYLNGKLAIPVPEHRRKASNRIIIKAARHHNLKSIDVDIPLQNLVVVTGVSGSGKTTLIQHILYPAMRKYLGQNYKVAPGTFDELTGDIDSITQVEMVGQKPIGMSSRSNPVTYVKAYDAIRGLMADQQLSKIRGYKPKHFSFNVDGGRCESCKGEGIQTIEMQFLADVQLVCEDCNGSRFKKEILEVNYLEKNISEILDLSVEEALDFFKGQKDIIKKIGPLNQVGLGYVKLGQSSSSLSGGEAQRVKLAHFLTKEKTDERILFIFDEPTTGLHFHDINKLLIALNALVERGHSVIVIEHNTEVIKNADWVIDLGPEAGKEGGHLVFEGTPEGLAKCKESYTGQYLVGKLK